MVQKCFKGHDSDEYLENIISILDYKVNKFVLKSDEIYFEMFYREGYKTRGLDLDVLR